MPRPRPSRITPSRERRSTTPSRASIHRLGRYGLQHLLRRLRAPLRRFVVHRGRQQERATSGDQPDAPVQPCDQRLEPRSPHGGRSLVSVRNAADERRDADHGRRSRYSGGTEDRRDAAGTEHCHAQPAALSVDGRRARWSRLLLGAGSDPAEARHGGRGLLGDLRAARRNQSRLRKPRGLRHRKDARGRRRVFVESPRS